jgi:phosphatidylserine/phosphatidylglycerophosphate/cardiolipin synthase-like enzyme
METTPAAHPVLDVIVETLRADAEGKQWEGITYSLSEKNKFTLLDTPRLWDTGPVAPSKIVAGETFCHAISSVIGQARTVVDISLLWWIGVGMPDGEFQAAIARGLAQCRAQVVRVIVGIPTAPMIVHEHDIEAWLAKVVPHDAAFSVHVGRTKHANPLCASWTHAKIIAADGRAAIVGGHNLWDGDYLKGHPVHDVSGLIEGPAVTGAHRFLDEVWRTSVHGAVISYRAGKPGREAPPATPPLPTDNVAGRNERMLALGRMGSFVKCRLGGLKYDLTHGSDAAVTARIIALCCAKTHIRISQQALGFSPAIHGGFDFLTCLALVAAAKDGVRVDIVVSSDRDMMGYNGHVTSTIAHLAQIYSMVHEHPERVPRRGELDKWLHLKHTIVHDILDHTSVGRHLLHRNGFKTEAEMTHFNSMIHIAPIHFAQGTNFWSSGETKKLAANHAKVYIIDDTNCFVGSDNFYVSGTLHGLQEFGYLIEGEAVKTFIADYWDNLWRNSSPYCERATQKMFD